MENSTRPDKAAAEYQRKHLDREALLRAQAQEHANREMARDFQQRLMAEYGGNTPQEALANYQRALAEEEQIRQLELRAGIFGKGEEGIKQMTRQQLRDVAVGDVLGRVPGQRKMTPEEAAALFPQFNQPPTRQDHGPDISVGEASESDVAEAQGAALSSEIDELLPNAPRTAPKDIDQRVFEDFQQAFGRKRQPPSSEARM